jgi:hypothetical protein
MTVVARFTQECPGLAGSLGRLYGREVADQFAQYYCEVADLGGNDELGVVRADGGSFNPRIARVISMVVQECKEVTSRVLRAAAYSTLLFDGEAPLEVRADIAAVRGATPSSPEWASCVALALMLDRIRHLHMADISVHEKERILLTVESSPLITPGGRGAENLRLKVIHGVAMQRRRLNMTETE